MTTDEVLQDLIDEAFREEALVIGGMAALGEICEEAVERAVGSLASARQGILARLGLEQMPDPEEPTPHPAVERFLAGLRAH